MNFTKFKNMTIKSLVYLNNNNFYIVIIIFRIIFINLLDKIHTICYNYSIIIYIFELNLS